jgi:PAS domain S-box-containing protein
MQQVKEKTLLVIDKQEKTRKVVRELLDEVDYLHFAEISSAGSVEELRENVLKLNPSIILFDINFDGIDPVSFIEQLCCEDNIRCQSILIVLSEPTQAEMAAAALRAGAGFFIEKSNIHLSLPGILRMVNQYESINSSLIEKERELKSIIETQQEMICRYKPDATLTFVNQAYAAMFGSEPEKLIGRRFLDFIPREEHENILNFLAGFEVNNPQMTYRHSVELPDGSIGWQEWTDYAFFDDDNKLTGYQAVGRDITREVLLSKALEKSEEKERRLIARDLHDHIGQMLAYIKLRIESGMTNVEGNDNHDFNEEILDLVIDSMQELRKVSRRVIAGFVKDEPLVDTIANLVESFE